MQILFSLHPLQIPDIFFHGFAGNTLFITDRVTALELLFILHIPSTAVDNLENQSNFRHQSRKFADYKMIICEIKEFRN